MHRGVAPGAIAIVGCVARLENPSS
jgi:hypothetical protein